MPISDIVLGVILESKGSQFLCIYKQKMNLIIEKINTSQFYQGNKLLDEKKTFLVLNYVKASIFELIKDDITSLNAGNVYLIDRVYYPYKSTHTLNNNSCITITAKNALLLNFIENFESLIKGMQNLIV